MRSLTRIAPINDAALLEYAYTLVDHVKEDLAAFTAFDQRFTSAVADELLALVQEAEATTSDRVVMRRQVRRTKEVNLRLAQLQEVVTRLRYFVNRAFPNQPEVQSDFYLDRLNLNKLSQAGRIMFLRDLGEAVNTHRQALVEAGCPEALLGEVQALYQPLKDYNKEQEKFKARRRLETDKRITCMNKVYRQVIRIQEAARIVFKGQESQLKKYRLPLDGRSTSYAPEAESPIQQAVPGHAAAYGGALAASTRFRFEHGGKGDLWFYLAEGPEAELPATYLRLAPGMHTELTADQLGWTPDRSLKLVVSNPGNEPQAYQLEVDAAKD